MVLLLRFECRQQLCCGWLPRRMCDDSGCSMRTRGEYSSNKLLLLIH